MTSEQLNVFSNIYDIDILNRKYEVDTEECSLLEIIDCNFPQIDISFEKFISDMKDIINLNINETFTTNDTAQVLIKRIS